MFNDLSDIRERGREQRKGEERDEKRERNINWWINPET